MGIVSRIEVNLHLDNVSIGGHKLFLSALSFPIMSIYKSYFSSPNRKIFPSKSSNML